MGHMLIQADLLSGITFHSVVNKAMSMGVGKSLAHISTLSITTTNYLILSILLQKEAVETWG